MKKSGGDVMSPAEWGMLNLYLNAIRVKLGNCGLNVIWTCLQKDNFAPDPQNQTNQILEDSFPMISGANRVTLPGACKLHIHAELEVVPSQSMAKAGTYEIRPVLWVAPHGKVKTLRHKYGPSVFPTGRIQDPEWPSIPTFRAIWMELGAYVYVAK